MLRRIRWIATWAAVTMVTVTVAVTLLTHRASPNSGGMVPAPLATGSPFEDPKPLPRIPLLNEDGKETSLQAFKGKFVVFAPAMTHCHEVCPMTTGVLSEVLQRLRKAGLASHVVVAEVTVDPWRDRPAVLRAYKRRFGVSLKMLTGSVPHILRLWHTLHILVERVPLEHPVPMDWYTHRPETLNIIHSDGLFFLDPAGAERIVATGMPKVEHGLSGSLKSLLDTEGVHNLEHPEAPWTASQVIDDLYWMMGREVPASSLRKARPPSREAAARELRGAPDALASLHRQAGQLLGSAGALRYRLGRLHGHPVVLNVWASWCGPCREEFPFFQSASVAFGREVAFLGYDADDPEVSNARAFLKDHPVSYPSYRGSLSALAPIATVGNTPSTIFIGARGRVLHVHIGAYETQTTLDSDIERYALGQHNVVIGHRVRGAGRRHAARRP